MLKHVKLFESFLFEAGTATVVSAKTIKLNKDIREQITLAAKLSKELKKLTDDYKRTMEPMQELLDKYDENILESLTGVEATQAKVGDTIAKVMMQKGRLSDSYKTLWEEALKKVNEATRKSLLEIQNANKKQNPDKYWMEYADTNEGLKDIKEWGSKLVDKFKGWAKDVWKNVKEAINGHAKAVDAFEVAGDKILKAVK